MVIWLWFLIPAAAVAIPTLLMNRRRRRRMGPDTDIPTPYSDLQRHARADALSEPAQAADRARNS